ncbi:sugar phosphate isomerase/epimerase [Paenibacillus sp. CGMCC 1.16610]|uniref:Sugar phosphate isomerase/epimerase n=2 Tax=Paenibacillus anseongense TaxID=2682845 RepID=A0ABW9U3K9_9BACL|nr:TIM barrel protein [Paenibacillus sp. CGMCC 1.16610]MBA2940838.1 sugar phosphate isomerase/epimerase [Paenibacillus sp. CGMCC 1.16610]MVQ34021.1 sugar phosphate isomerase/epimerase [Paenibacillus anseongense]
MMTVNSHLRLDVQQSWWAMSGLGNGETEWSMEQKFEKLAEAGFTGILGRLPQGEEADKWHRLLQKYGFSFGVQMVPFPRAGEDIRVFLQAAKQFGARYINAQVLDQYTVGIEAISGLNGLIQQAEEVGIPFFVETHRGRVTQDLLRTAEYVDALPKLRLTNDLSHYIVGSAIAEEGVDPVTEGLFAKLLQRTSSIHARVSNGNQVQVDIGEHGEHPMVQHFAGWWREGMRYWAQTAAEGDFFPFVCELGPASYAMVREDGKEISNRWEQALVFKKIAEELWHAIHSN